MGDGTYSYYICTAVAISACTVFTPCMNRASCKILYTIYFSAHKPCMNLGSFKILYEYIISYTNRQTDTNLIVCNLQLLVLQLQLLDLLHASVNLRL